jgi:hypothetical protein
MLQHSSQFEWQNTITLKLTSPFMLQKKKIALNANVDDHERRHQGCRGGPSGWCGHAPPSLGAEQLMLLLAGPDPSLVKGVATKFSQHTTKQRNRV